jgi:hypothetical protein
MPEAVSPNCACRATRSDVFDDPVVVPVPHLKSRFVQQDRELRAEPAQQVGDVLQDTGALKGPRLHRDNQVAQTGADNFKRQIGVKAQATALRSFTVSKNSGTP